MKRFIHFCTNWFVKLTGCILQLIIFRPKYFYQDKQKQGKRIKGKAIVIANHTSLMDFATLLFLFWRRTLRCVVAELMFRKNPPLSLLLRMLGTIKVDRDTHDFAFLGKCQSILDKGGVVEIFPEARLPDSGDTLPLPFKPSTAYLALESGAPIIPVYIRGPYFGRNRVHVIVGTPIDARALYDNTLSQIENIENITNHLRGTIIELKQELERQEKGQEKAL